MKITLSPTVAEMSPGEQRTIRRALNLLARQLREPGVAFTSTHVTRDWLRLHLTGLEREVFIVLWLDNQNRLLAQETLFTGTINNALRLGTEGLSVTPIRWAVMDISISRRIKSALERQILVSETSIVRDANYNVGVLVFMEPQLCLLHSALLSIIPGIVRPILSDRQWSRCRA